MPNTHTHFHAIVYFYEIRDERGNFANSTKIDVRSDKEDIVEAVEDIIAKAKKLADAKILDSSKTARRFYHVADVVEHDHVEGLKEQL